MSYISSVYLNTINKLNEISLELLETRQNKLSTKDSIYLLNLGLYIDDCISDIFKMYDKEFANEEDNNIDISINNDSDSEIDDSDSEIDDSEIDMNLNSKTDDSNSEIDDSDFETDMNL